MHKDRVSSARRRLTAFTFGSLGLVLPGGALLLAIGSCEGEKPITVDEYCTNKATRECEKVAPMCLVDPATCTTARKALCLQAVPDLAQRPFQPDAVGPCLNKTSEIYGKPTITPVDRQVADDLCARVFSGMKKVGETCSNDFDCVSPTVCHLRGTDPRLCAMRIVVSAGAFCNNPGETCPAGEYCAGLPGFRRCQARKAQGEPCDTENLCAETLRCDESSGAGTCAARRVAGEMCASNEDCAPTAPYCDPYWNNTCDTGFTPSRGAPECAAFGAPTTAAAATSRAPH